MTLRPLEVEAVQTSEADSATDEFQFFLTESATRALFDSAMQARRQERLTAIRQLLHFAAAERLLSVAIERFRLGGNTDRLNLASNLLSTMGNRALPSYLEMVRRLRDEDRTLLESLPLSELSDSNKLRVLCQMRQEHPNDPITDELWEATFPSSRVPTWSSGWGMFDAAGTASPADQADWDRLRQLVRSISKVSELTDVSASTAAYAPIPPPEGATTAD